MGKSSPFAHLLKRDLQNFIVENEKADETALVLKHRKILGVHTSDIAQQIVGRRKAKAKLPLLYSTQQIIYPPKINIEQCSSERTAFFKSKLQSGKLAVDLTGGLGVDSFYLSKKFEKVIHIEPNASLLEIAKHNHFSLGAKNIEYHCSDAESFLKSSDEHFDLVFVDPSRRSNANRKVFKFSDCSPNVVSLLPALLEKSASILIKASPLIDIQQGLRDLTYVSEVFVVGFDNECKEILFLITPKNKEPVIKAVDLLQNEANPPFAFTFFEERKSNVKYSDPMQFLYEPSAMILKTGAFKLVTKKFGLHKLAPNTHLYTSDKIVYEFSGRIFKIEHYLKSDSKSIRDAIPEGYANIFTRNYPLSPSQLKKKLRTSDGGEKFVIGFSGRQKKYLVLAHKVK